MTSQDEELTQPQPNDGEPLTQQRWAHEGARYALSGTPKPFPPAGIPPCGSKALFKVANFPGIPHGPNDQTQKQLSPGAEDPAG